MCLDEGGASSGHKSLKGMHSCLASDKDTGINHGGEFIVGTSVIHWTEERKLESFEYVYDWHSKTYKNCPVDRI